MPVRNVKGFTLLELAIVITIVAIVTSMGLVATIGAMESAKRTATENKLNAIEDALMAFREAHDRLPCPSPNSLASTSTSYGIEAGDPGSCIESNAATELSIDTASALYPSIMEGAVPVKALNLPIEFMYDGWGRRFSYRVMTALTGVDAFTHIHPKETCGMTVRGTAAIARSTNAAYTLLSYGPNGHGAYLPNAQRMNAGSVNDEEHENCHCTSAAVNTAFSYVSQLDFVEDPTNSLNTFDDIARYKERWQMQTTEDERNFGTYSLIEAIIGYDNSAGAGTTQAMSLYRNCTNFRKHKDIGMDAGGNTVLAALTPDKKYIFMYSDLTTCQAHLITNDNFDNATNYWSTIGSSTGCPIWDDPIVGAMSNNGYLFLTQKTSPYLVMWHYASGKFNLVPMSQSSVLTAKPLIIAVSRNAEHIFVSDLGGYSRIYQRRADNSLYLLTVTSGLLPKDINAAAFSQDGRFFAFIDNGSPVPLRILVKISPVEYTELGGGALTDTDGNLLADGLNDTVKHIAFSPDGQYLAVAPLGPGGTMAKDYYIYKIDGKQDGSFQFTKITIVGDYPDYGTANGKFVMGLKFSADSSTLLAIDKKENDSFQLMHFKKINDKTFYFVGGADEVPGDDAVPNTLTVVY